MRTVLGSAALCVGGFLSMVTFLMMRQFSGVPLWVSLASGCLAVVLAIAGILLLGKRDKASGRGVIVGLSLVAGLAGLIFAIGSKNYAFGKYCGIEGRNDTYKLTVRVFGRELYEESQPAVQQEHSGQTITGPPQDLETKMVCWELGLDAALIAMGALLGGLLGVVIRRGLKKG